MLATGAPQAGGLRPSSCVASAGQPIVGCLGLLVARVLCEDCLIAQAVAGRGPVNASWQFGVGASEGCTSQQPGRRLVAGQTALMVVVPGDLTCDTPSSFLGFRGAPRGGSVAQGLEAIALGAVLPLIHVLCIQGMCVLISGCSVCTGSGIMCRDRG